MAKAAKKSNKKSISKSELFASVAEATGASKADVRKFFEVLESIVTKQLGKKGPGVIQIPGLIKLTAVSKPASKGGEKKPNPFKPGEFIVTKPKPASVRVKARALKAFQAALMK